MRAEYVIKYWQVVYKKLRRYRVKSKVVESEFDW